MLQTSMDSEDAAGKKNPAGLAPAGYRIDYMFLMICVAYSEVLTFLAPFI